MAITIPVTHAAKQKNSRKSPKSTDMFALPFTPLCWGHVNIPRNCLQHSKEIAFVPVPDTGAIKIYHGL
jgi:hypothetical protein